MNIEKLFDFLVNDYGLNYKYQQFSNCWGLGYFVNTYSFYNYSGCFTIQHTLQSNEIDFYHSFRFSTNREELCEKGIDIFSIEPEIWEKSEKIWLFKKPFYWWSNKNLLNTLSKVLKIHISKYNNFFDIQV